MAELEDLVDRLESAARALREPGLSSERAAELADECARLAAQAADALETAVRAPEPAGPGRDQLRLGS